MTCLGGKNITSISTGGINRRSGEFLSAKRIESALMKE
jgi:hypothetical protein